jgi:hypothetical protein
MKEGEKISWRVEATAECEGVAYVEAASKEEAEALADDLGAAAFDWEPVRSRAIIIETVEANP